MQDNNQQQTDGGQAAQPQAQWTQEQYNEYQQQLAAAQAEAANASTYTQGPDPFSVAQDYTQNEWAQPLSTDQYQVPPQAEYNSEAVDAQIAQEYAQMGSFEKPLAVTEGEGNIFSRLYSHRLLLLGLLVGLFVIGSLTTIFVKNGGLHSSKVAKTSTSEDGRLTGGSSRSSGADEELTTSDSESEDGSDDGGESGSDEETGSDDESLGFDDAGDSSDGEGIDWGDSSGDDGGSYGDSGGGSDPSCDTSDPFGGCYVENPVPLPPPAPTPPPSNPTARLTFATYYTKDDLTPAQIVADVKKLTATGADVIGLQGMLDSRRGAAIASSITCATCAYAGYLPTGNDSADVPILWKKSRITNSGAGISTRAAAGTTTIRTTFLNAIRLNAKDINRTFYVLNNHGIATGETNGKPTYDATRTNIFQAQMNTLKDRVNAYSLSGDPIIVTGMYYVNYRTDSQVKYSLYPFVNTGAVATRANWQRLGTPAEGTFIGTGRLVDYVHSRDHVRLNMVSQQILTGYSSNHNPVIVTFDLKSQ